MKPNPDPEEQTKMDQATRTDLGVGEGSITEEDQPAAAPTEANNFWGMLLVAAFLLFYTICSAIISYNEGCTLQWMLGRYLAFLVFCPIAWVVRKPEQHTRFYGDTLYDTKVICLHAILEILNVYTYFYALHMVYVGDMEAIFLFIAPNLIAFLGRFCFKEALPQNIVFIIIVNIVGVIFVTQPSFIFPSEKSIDTAGLVLVLSSTILYSLDITLIGQHPNIHWMQFQIGSGLLTIAVLLPVCYGIDRLPWTEGGVLSGGSFDFSWSMLAWNAAVGAFSLLSQVCLIYGYQMGASTKVTYLEYVNLIFAYSIQWILFDEFRSVFEIIGAVLIASTSLILLYSQYRLYDEERNSTGRDSEYASLLGDEEDRL
mmetsp:Transcript_7075/g.11102  ORF Transcript_7075/g.11102 Transcript_7075/m.11102 type:complete len:371 (+) Transcript_7075:60-1172(+)